LSHGAVKLACSALVLALATPLRADAIDDYVNAELQRQRIPGLALAIIRDGELQRAQGYGFANLEHRVPVHADTVFQAASVGKQFTATAVMLMVEDGKLRLDETLRTYLPESPASWAPITTRHLLTHTSGLDSSPSIDLRKDYTDDELLAVIYGARQLFPPGKGWSYSNTAYALLGLLVKKVGGESYIEVLRKRVFAPLNMTTADLINDRAIVPNRAAGYEIVDGKVMNQRWVAPTANSTADGSLSLTVLDFARWEAGIRAGKILEAQSWKQVSQPVTLSSGRTYPYGFGWSLETEGGRQVWRHSGAWQGFTAFFIRYPDDGVAVVVMTNSSGGNPGTIARHVAGLFEPTLAPQRAGPIEDRAPEPARRANGLLDQLATGRVDASQFDWQSGRPLEEVATQDQKLVQPLGRRLAVQLFARHERGDDTVYRYRARYETGLRELRLVLGPDDRIRGYRLTEISAWDEPLTPD